jgi:hypothetical protein
MDPEEFNCSCRREKGSLKGKRKRARHWTGQEEQLCFFAAGAPSDLAVNMVAQIKCIDPMRSLQRPPEVLPRVPNEVTSTPELISPSPRGDTKTRGSISGVVDWRLDLRFRLQEKAFCIRYLYDQ